MRYSASLPLIKFYGLKRCGNHAIINWVLPKGHFDFYNNIVHIAPILRQEKELPPPVSYRVWLRRKHPLRKRIALRSPPRTVLVSLEDHFLDYSPFHSEPRATINVCILRDPANMFASRIQKAAIWNRQNPTKSYNPAYPPVMGKHMTRVIGLWKSYAREFLGDTKTLRNKVAIYYNAWYRDPVYRRSICDQLGLNYDDTGFMKMSGHGGGSSFDGMKYNDRTTNMEVLTRFQQLDDTGRCLLEQILSDNELVELSSRVEEMVAHTR